MSNSDDSDKKHSWSFGFKSKKNVKPLTITPAYTQPISLPKQFFAQLIKLEADFQNKLYTLDTLNQLTQYYAKAVEHYDNLKDNISAYFIFKIQDILATKQSLTMLSEHQHQLEENESKGANREKLGDSSKKSLQDGLDDDVVEEVSEDEEDVEIGHIERKRMAARKNRNRIDRASISQIRNEKQRFVHFFYKMENEKLNEKQNMHNVINEYTTAKERNDLRINSDLDKQKERLHQKLEQRKLESFSQTININSYRNPLNLSNNEEKKEQTLDLMLKELDDGDEVEYGKSSTENKSAHEMSPQNLSIHDDDGNEPLQDDERIRNPLSTKNLNNENIQQEQGKQIKKIDLLFPANKVKGEFAGNENMNLREGL